MTWWLDQNLEQARQKNSQNLPKRMGGYMEQLSETLL